MSEQKHLHVEADVLTTADNVAWMDAFNEWLESRGEEAGSSVTDVDRLRAENDALRKRPSVEELARALYGHDALTHHWGKSWEEVANWERETYLDRPAPS